MTNFSSFPVPKPLGVWVVYPTAVVTKGRWTDFAGNQMAVAGARAFGVAQQNFSAAEVAAAAGGAYPVPSLTITILGGAEVELGATVADRAYCATDNVGRSVTAGANDAVLCWLPYGGEVGQMRPALILRVDETRVAGAAIPDLVAASGAADGTIADVGGAFSQGTLNDNFKDLATKLNAVLALLRSQKLIAP